MLSRPVLLLNPSVAIYYIHTYLNISLVNNDVEINSAPGGTVLTHGTDDHVEAIQADILIEGSTITKIEKGIQSGAETEVIDCCTDKILSPGFIDTHYHL